MTIQTRLAMGSLFPAQNLVEPHLSEGWATDFIRAVLQKFIVVFVGYAADDPPMQYLLEALNRTAGSSSGVYAFQSGSKEDAEARWVQKGYNPFPTTRPLLMTPCGIH